jgi:Nucleotidyl transferase AbiEii toxin, Type IV TA system
LNITRNEEVLAALGERLVESGERLELVVIGGSALLGLGLVDRATRDVDLVALRRGALLVRPDPLPEALLEAVSRIALDFNLPRDWLNTGPSSLLDFGLPRGFESRLERRDYGDFLTVWLASRLDQIHFKLYAVVDQGPGKHEQDLRALDPSDDELLEAARWTITHDPSSGFRQELLAALAFLGVEDADLGA